MDWALNAMRQTENGFDGIPNVSDDMGIVKLRGLPFGCSKDEIIQFFDGKGWNCVSSIMFLWIDYVGLLGILLVAVLRVKSLGF